MEKSEVETSCGIQLEGRFVLKVYPCSYTFIDFTVSP